jgi:hypothetical protein
MTTRNTFLFAVAALTGASAFAQGFMDDMSSSSYTSFSLVLGANFSEFDFGTSQEPTGGNPDDQFVVTHNFLEAFDASISPGGQTVHIYNSFSWTPSVDGFIESIRYSLDYSLTDSAFSSLGFVIQSPSTGMALLASIATIPGWKSVDSGTLTSAQIPDSFLTGSEPLFFGFTLYSDRLESVGTAESHVSGFDNFSVSLSIIPEPSTYAMLAGAACLGLALLRRRS